MGIPSVILYWTLGLYSVAWGICAAVSVSMGNLWLLHRNRNISLCAHIGVGTLFALLLCDNIVTGGFDRPNFSWLYVVPMVAATMLDLRGAWTWLGVTLATTVGFCMMPARANKGVGVIYLTIEHCITGFDTTAGC